jgi:hypothetical protein
MSRTGLIRLSLVVTASGIVGACGDSASEPIGVVGVVAAIDVTPAGATLVLGQTERFRVLATDAQGSPVTGATYTWTSSNASVVTVDGLGVVTAIGEGSASVTATAGGVSGAAAVTVVAITFASVSSDDSQTCALTLPNVRSHHKWRGLLLGIRWRGADRQQHASARLRRSRLPLAEPWGWGPHVRRHH